MSLLEGVAAACLLLGGLWMGVSAFKGDTPTPSYRLIETVNQSECRLYQDVTMVIKSKDSDNRAFQQLFQYISGKNSKNQKISMTAPVLTGDDSEMFPELPNENWLAFIMPENMAAPNPLNSSLKVVTLPNMLVMVKPFSGTLSTDKVKEIVAELYNDAALINKQPIATPIIAQYDPPYVFPLFRKNEVWLPVSQSQNESKEKGSR